jgi:transposase
MARRKGYPSDLNGRQWELVELLLPPVRTGGRPEKHPRRAIVDAILYVVRTGCSWRQLPSDFPPWQTVYWYFIRWEDAKVTEKILAAVREQLRVQEGRNAAPSAGLVDSQTVKGADTVGADIRGYDAGKRINGRKRFIVTATLGLLITVVVCAASMQDRDGAKPVLLQAYLASQPLNLGMDRWGTADETATLQALNMTNLADQAVATALGGTHSAPPAAIRPESAVPPQLAAGSARADSAALRPVLPAFDDHPSAFAVAATAMTVGVDEVGDRMLHRAGPTPATHRVTPAPTPAAAAARSA